MVDSLPCGICGDPVYFDGTDTSYVEVQARTVRVDARDDVMEYYVHTFCAEAAIGGWRTP